MHYAVTIVTIIGVKVRRLGAEALSTIFSASPIIFSLLQFLPFLAFTTFHLLFSTVIRNDDYWL